MTGHGHPQAPDPPHGEPGHEHAHDHDHDPAADPFPRIELSRLVGHAERARVLREGLQVWVLGVAVALVALGLSTGRVVWPRGLVLQAAGQETSLGLLAPLARAFADAAGTTVEPAAFLLSALALGLLVPALRGLLVAVGFPHGLALLASGLVVLAPGLALAGTLPLDFTAGALGATWLARGLFHTAERRRLGYVWRVTSLLLLAILLRLENLLLLPAAAWAAARQGATRGLPRGLGAGAVVLVTLVCLEILVGSGGARQESTRYLVDELLGGGEPSLAALARWPLWIPGFLGVGALGLWSLLLGRRAPEESPPPRWVVPFCAAALLPVFAGDPAHGPAGAALVPMAALGLADGLQRVERDERRRRLILGAVLAQLVLLFGVNGALRARDPEARWRTVARHELDPDDVLVTASPLRAHVARWRFGLPCALVEPGDGPARLQELVDSLEGELAGRRLVLDRWPTSAGAAPPAFPAALEERADAALAPPTR